MIYLDYAASSPPYEEVCRLTAETMRDTFANPAGLHSASASARRIIRESRAVLGSLMGFDPGGILFTSGGTESNNTVLKALPAISRRRHLIISAVEHRSVILPARSLAAAGFEISYVLPDRDGYIGADAVTAALRPDTALVCVQAANNETGVIHDIAGIAQAAHRAGALFHCDAVQSFGHAALALSCADTVSVSAHKLGGPRGVGCLAVRTGLALPPLLSGGGQEFGMRSGTENTAGIAGFALAAQLSCGELEREHARLTRLSRFFTELLRQEIASVCVNSGAAERLPGIINLRFPGLNGELLMTRLNDEGICISVGSACAARDAHPSHVLTAAGLDESAVKESVRISFGRLTTEAEMRTAAEAICRIYRECASCAF